MKIFLSSTATDLTFERRQAKLLAEAAGHEVLWMEEQGSRSVSAWEQCEHDIADSELFILLVGRRYGSMLLDSGASYTEQEYELAQIYGIPTLGFIQAGPLDYVDADAPLRLKEFVDRVRHEYVVAPSFRDLAELATQVHHALANSASERPQPPRFHRTRRAIADPLRYATAAFEREILEDSPFSVVIVDHAVISEQTYPDSLRRLLGNKALQIRADLQRQGVHAYIFNEIERYGPRQQVLEQRAEQARLAEAIIALISRPSDLEQLSLFEPFEGTLIVCYPDRIHEDDVTTCDVPWHFSRRTFEPANSSARPPDPYLVS